MAKTRPFHRHQIVELDIQDMAFEGKGISKVATEAGNYVVFVPHALPGQKVSARIIKPKARYAEAKLLAVLERSPEEIPQAYFPIPGAPFLHLPLERQRDFKQSSSIELFRRIGKIAQPEALFDEFITSPRDFHYRNKMEYSFSAVGAKPGSEKLEDGFFLGFKKRGQWLAVEKLEGDSGLFDAEFENFLPQIADYFEQAGLSAWHSREHHGFCRLLTVKKSYRDELLLVNFVSAGQDLHRFDAEDFSRFMQKHLGRRLGGLIHTVNADPSDRPKAEEGLRNLLYGEEELTESILGLDFKISIESFFQTNPASAEKLYAKALDYVMTDAPGPQSVVLDLFSGTGTISQLLAQALPDREVIGVEIVAEAVEDARRNAAANGFTDLRFFCADVGRFLYEHPQYQGRIHSLCIDPPRAGIAPKTLRKIIGLGAQRIIYISCNPATQARDMEILAEAGYQLERFSLVDQFPHTAHVESVALFALHEKP